MYLSVTIIILIISFGGNFAMKKTEPEAKSELQIKYVNDAEVRNIIHLIGTGLMSNWSIGVIKQLLADLPKDISDEKNKSKFVHVLKKNIFTEAYSKIHVSGDALNRDLLLNQYRKLKASIDDWVISDECVEKIAKFRQEKTALPNSRKVLEIYNRKIQKALIIELLADEKLLVAGSVKFLKNYVLQSPAIGKTETIKEKVKIMELAK